MTSKYVRIAKNTTVVLALIAGLAAAQMQIARSTIDGGGVIHSVGGSFELSGTIGQADAGTLSGGAFRLTGGFWFELAPTDCNEDGAVNLFDHSTFTECLTGPNNDLLSGCECFDVDLSGAVDLRDFAMAQIEFSRS